MRTTASPGARKEISTHAGWELWDGEDLSRYIRTLPLDQAVRLVDTYFPGGVRPIAVRVPRDTVARPLRPGEVRGLGRRPVSLRLTSRDGARVEVAVAEESSSLLVGPFLTADPGLHRAPPDPRAPHDRSV